MKCMTGHREDRGQGIAGGGLRVGCGRGGRGWRVWGAWLGVVVGAGWAWGIAAQVVINEIHSAPDVDTEAVEFVELVNAGTNAVALGGWTFTDGFNYTFPATNLAAGGYVVVAQNPAALWAKFGVGALGPFNAQGTSQLSGQGERLTLRDAEGRVVDEVTYGLGFPWPTVGEPPGYSLELIHPGLDNDLGGHWRASVAGGATEPREEVYIEQNSVWRYFKGTQEPSIPAGGWRAIGFDDGGWLTGVAPVGYGSGGDPIRTELGDMRYNYSTVYFRRKFTVTDPGSVSGLLLEAVYDDGFKVWINGSNVLNVNISSGELPYTGTAGGARESAVYELFTLGGVGALRAGENVIAVQACNSSIGSSSDFFFDARLRSVTGPTGRGPTPGRQNAAYATNAPPAARQVAVVPEQPRAGESVRVSVKVTDPEGVASVVLEYQVVEPGAYIELGDAAYADPANWRSLAMNDLGADGDAVAGDDTYTCTVPASVQGHRRLVRYRMTVADGLGASVRLPYADDPQPNFAYFVYDGVPGWRGAVRPGVTAAVEVSAAEMGRLPTYHLIAKNRSVVEATWTSRYRGDAYLWWGTLVYDGRVYDHIRYRARGGVWRYSMAKNMWKFDFNRGHDFRARDNWGRRFRVGWTKLNLGASIQQGDYQHRGEQGMFESVGFRLFQLMGVPSPHTTFVTFRVIDGVAEAEAGTQYEGDFWGLYLAVEQEDGRFLEEHGLADGNLYKMEGGTGELNNLGPLGPTDKSDLNAFLGGQGGATDGWWRANLDLASYYGYQAVVQAIHHYDIADGKNYFYYRNPGSGRWTVVPWDLDLTWADNMYRAGAQGGDEPFKSRVLGGFAIPGPRPGISTEFRNRVREFRDLLWNQDEGYRLIDEYAALLRGPAGGWTILDADRAMWDFNPKMADGSYTDNPGSKAGQGRYYQWPLAPTVTKDFEGAVQLMKNYVVYRSTEAFLATGMRGLDAVANDPNRPVRPTAVYVGPAGFPVNQLRFEASAFLAGNPTNRFGAIQWRVGEVTRPQAPSYDPGEPQRYEIEATWQSTNTAPEWTVTVPPPAVKPGRVYRVRVQMVDDAGRASGWSGPVEFLVGEPDNYGALTNYLRVTEVMYEPGGDGVEFVELHNPSGSVTLALNGVAFTQGIDYTFPEGVQLAPGGYLVLAKTADVAAFRQAFGVDPSVLVLGPYEGSLANGGETVVLRTAAGGTDIVAFTYREGRGWPAAAAGGGHSLVWRGPSLGEQGTGAGNDPGQWRASTFRGGSPGRADPVVDDAVVLNEVVAHTDFATAYDSNDWIELYNRSETDFVFGPGWYLSDDAGEPAKWMIPVGTRVAGRGWVTFDEVTGFHNPTNTGFGLSKAGEQVVLAYLPGTAEDRLVDVVRFEGQENEWSWGRYPDGGPFWRALTPATRGEANGAPPAGVYFSEVMYHPPDLAGVDNTADEYLEWHNPGSVPVALYNASGAWRLNGAVDLVLPGNVEVPAWGYVVAVSFDPADGTALSRFTSRYGSKATNVVYAGPYTGKLANSADRIALERPQAPDVPGEPVSWVIVDEVYYADRAPWPVGADGWGEALHRSSFAGAGSDPARWRADLPTPGWESEGDGDGDGMPDDWERRYGLDPAYGADGAADADGDGLTNAEEYRAGTDPREAGSVLALQAVGAGADWRLRFQAVAGRAYVVESLDAIGGSGWVNVLDVPPPSATRWVEITNTLPRLGVGFFRVVIPPGP